MSDIKTCSNCSYYNGSDRCLRSDLSTQTTKFSEMGCDVNFSGWKEIPKIEIRPPTIEEIENLSSEWKIIKRK